MSIQTTVTKAAMKQVGKGWKMLFEKVRVWATRGARKRQGKEMINPYVIAFAMLSLTGCKTLDNALIAADDKLYGSSTALVATPPGYDARPYVIDAGANRIDVTGWQIRWELVQASTFTPTMLTDAIAKPRKQSVMGPVMDLIDKQDAAPTADLDALQQQILDAAK
jgi:hypothetical protein